MVKNNLRNDIKINKNKIMENFEEAETNATNAINGTTYTYTTAERLALTPSTGQQAYDTELGTLFIYDGSFWVAII
jgi:hypothetical protein